ncbi:agmatine deiminase [Rhodothermaceae bacterium RA]|nr:agmatine deiminase [Rhodothermaceae bacterium RA]
MPPEWAAHQGTWFSWPHNPDTWADHLEAAERALARAVHALGLGETVHINVLDAAHESRLRRLLGAAADAYVRYHRIPTNDAWCRDHGPIFVTNPTAEAPLAATIWRFNAWGGKYPPYDLDDAAADRMAEALSVPRFRADLVLEGGSIEVNGNGLLLTTEPCLLNPNRNPGLTRADWEPVLQQMFGVEKVLWLGGELAGDDTDGHIDNLARFVDDRTVVAMIEADRTDPNYAGLQDNLRRLRTMTDLAGRPLEVLTLPMPAPVVIDGRRMPASYANFYIGNRVVLLPAYGDPNDAVARDLLQRCFPDRLVVAIDCRAIIWGLGAFHCLSQQVPAV